MKPFVNPMWKVRALNWKERYDEAERRLDEARSDVRLLTDTLMQAVDELEKKDKAIKERDEAIDIAGDSIAWLKDEIATKDEAIKELGLVKEEIQDLRDQIIGGGQTSDVERQGES